MVVAHAAWAQHHVRGAVRAEHPRPVDYLRASTHAEPERCAVVHLDRGADGSGDGAGQEGVAMGAGPGETEKMGAADFLRFHPPGRGDLAYPAGATDSPTTGAAAGGTAHLRTIPQGPALIFA